MPTGKIIFLLCLMTLNGFAQPGKIFGLWQNNQLGYQMSLILNADGSGEFDGKPIQFSEQASQLSIKIGTVTTQYTYVLQDNSLILSGGDLDGKVTFSRSGTEIKSLQASVGNAKPDYGKTSKELIGYWSGNGEAIEFRPDGKCVYQGSAFAYQAMQGHIVLSTGQGNVSFAYDVVGTQLTLTANGQRVIYNKVPGSGLGTPANPYGNKNVAMELVGNWCYMNMSNNSQTSRCITLNADGTYVYHAESSRSVNTETAYGATSSQGDDQGTWYVEGDRIFYNSPTKGQGSYRLEKRNHPKNVNDPMIVLDGEPYVTTTMRSPWR